MNPLYFKCPVTTQMRFPVAAQEFSVVWMAWKAPGAVETIRRHPVREGTGHPALLAMGAVRAC